MSNFVSAGSSTEAGAMLIRLVDFLKSQGITSLFTNLVQGSHDATETDVGISSIIDTWLLLRDTERNGERCGALYVLKSRGMSHSKQVREFRLSDTGIDIGHVLLSENREREPARGGEA